MGQYNRYMVAVLLALTVACSGGGGGGGGTPASGPDTTGGSGMIGEPPAEIKLPDGSIKKPDGSIVDTNGIVKKPDGSVVFPEGTIKLPDGTMKLPSGAIAKKDGTVLSAPPLPVPGGSIEEPGVAVVPTAAISGVEDGGLYSSQSALTASAKESKDAVSYSWSLSGGDLESALASKEEHFTFTLPAPKGDDSVAYTLQLKTSSKSGDVAEKKIVINAAAVPVVVLGCDAKNGENWAVGQEFDCTTYSSKNASKYIWKVEEKIGAATGTVNFTFYKPEEYQDKAIVFMPAKIGTYTVTATAEGPGGKVSKSMSFNTKNLPIAKITGITKGAYYSTESSISADGNQSTPQGEISKYYWTLMDPIDGMPLEDSVSGATYQKKLPKGSYQLQLQVIANDLGGSDTVAFEVVDPPKAVVKITDANNNVADSFKVGDIATLFGDTSSWQNPSKFTWTITFTPSGGGAPVVSSKEGFNVFHTLDKPGQYDIQLTLLDVAGTSKASKTITAKYDQAVGKISGISPISYRMQELTASGASSTNAKQYAWSLKKDNVEEASFNTADIQFTPADFGAYSLQLVAGNEGGDADPVSVAFNVRAAQGMQMMPFTMQAQDAVLALGNWDVYVGGAGGLYHLGVDLQWVNVIDVPVQSIWARSSNDVFAGATSSVFHYTAATGWKELKSALMQNGVTSLTGYGDKRLYAVTAGTKLIMSGDNGANWVEVPNVMAVHAAAMPNQKIAVSTKDGKLQIIDGDVIADTLDPGVAGLVWSSMYVFDPNAVFLAASDGRIYLYDGTKLSPFDKLPIETINNVATQQYAKAMWVSNGELQVISQDGAHYSTTGGNMNTLVSPGAISVSAVSGGTVIVAVDGSSTPRQLSNAQWSLMSSTGDKLLTVQGTDAGFPRTEARGIGTSAFLLNAKSVKDGKTYYLQQIKENGTRIVLPVDAPVLDVWGLKENKVYILTATRIHFYNGVTVTNTDFPTKVPNTTEKISAIAGDSSGLKYAVTNLGVYQFDAANNFTQMWTSQAGDVNFRTLWVSPTGTVFAGAVSGDIIAIDTNGNVKTYGLNDPLHQILGASEARLYATTDNKVFVFDEANNVWSEIPVPGGAAVTPHNIAMVNSSELFFSAGASGMLHYSAKILSVVTGLPAGSVVYAAHAGQFTYYGIMDPNTGDVVLYKSGPMQ